MILADALYAWPVLALLIVGLVVVNIVDAWKRVEWAEWWASTRTSEEGAQGAGGSQCASSSGARRPTPETSLPRSAGARNSEGSRR